MRVLLPALLSIAAVSAAAAQDPTWVDDRGVLRWTDSREEVALFGVNYTTPFAHAYRAHGRLGVDRKAAIDADVAHFDRLGFDVFRVHVWEREVSDSLGNLLSNDHLDLYDYLVARLAERGIRTVLTPVAWWPTGYPEPAKDTGSWIDPFSKTDLAFNPAALAAQERYFDQWVRHVNPYRGLAYKDDPAVVALEFVNEPNHPDTTVTRGYIDRLVRVARRAGWTKPLFYNIAETYTPGHGRAVCASSVQGVTMQWYPTSLVRGRSLGGNMLPNVDRYPTPFDAFPGCEKKARLVYEFDAADVAGSHMYPAMTRSFRGAGVQIAAQFAYDPMAMAAYNTEYQTHFVNLVHAPGKAISLLIAAEAFRRVPRRASFPAYPASARFEAGGAVFRVSYGEDLSEMSADTLFYHSNTTATEPVDRGALRHVAGVGSSPVVRYAGTGAYFLDRLAPGAWRLEVYPDAVWVEDPFTRGSLDRRAIEIQWAERPMTIDLPDLGPEFSAAPVDEGNGHIPRVEGGAFAVRPGVYLLTRPGVAKPSDVRAEFHAPAATAGAPRIVHTPPAEAESGRPTPVRVTVSSAERPDSVVVFFVGGQGPGGWMPPVRLASSGGPVYTGELPARRPGLLEYRITVFAGGRATSFPGAAPGVPWDWDFTGQGTFTVPVVEARHPLALFDAARDRHRMLLPSWFAYVRFRSDFVEGRTAGDLAFRAEVPDFGPEPHHFAARAHLSGPPPGRLAAFGPEAVLRVVARSAGRERDRLEVAITLADGSAWSAVVDTTPEWKTYEIPVASLRRSDLFLLPRPYPAFPPYRFRASGDAAAPDLATLDGVQFAVGREHFAPEELDGTHGFEVESVELVPDREFPPSP